MIPADVRNRAGLCQGARVSFEVNPDGSVTLRAAAVDIRMLKVSLKQPPEPVSVDDMNTAIAARRRAIAAKGAR